MPLVRDAYRREMRDLVGRAIDAWLASSGTRPAIFTVSIWTDPNARSSAVSIDTRDNSDTQVRSVNEYNRAKHAQFVSDGDLEMAALFEALATRNCNPADFAYREFASCEHKSFPSDWESRSNGLCWDELEPALADVAMWACTEFRKLKLELGSELAVNSRRDWYDATWTLLPNN